MERALHSCFYFNHGYHRALCWALSADKGQCPTNVASGHVELHTAAQKLYVITVSSAPVAGVVNAQDGAQLLQTSQHGSAAVGDPSGAEDCWACCWGCMTRTKTAQARLQQVSAARAAEGGGCEHAQKLPNCTVIQRHLLLLVPDPRILKPARPCLIVGTCADCAY